MKKLMVVVVLVFCSFWVACAEEITLLTPKVIVKPAIKVQISNITLIPEGPTIIVVVNYLDEDGNKVSIATVNYEGAEYAKIFDKLTVAGDVGKKAGVLFRQIVVSQVRATLGI